MLSLHAAGAPLTLLTLFDCLPSEEIPAAYLGKLSDTVPSAAPAPFYINVLREAARVRAIRRLLAEIEDRANHGQESDALVAALEASLFELRHQGNASATTWPEEALKEIIATAEERIRTGATGPTGVASGFSQLDTMTGGFQPGDLVLVAARTSIGKSALALSFIEKQLALGYRAGLASLEMSAVQVWQRLLAMHSCVSTGRLRFGHLDVSDIRVLKSAAEELSGAGLGIIDRCDLTAGVLHSWASQMVVEGCSILYVDYVGLLRGSGNGAPRWEQMAEISRNLKSIARELRIPVVALVQLNREAADAREPGLHNIRDSGALEQDADVVMLLTRSEAENTEDTVPARLLLKKQRSGPTGKIDLLFRRSLTQFSESAAAPAQAGGAVYLDAPIRKRARRAVQSALERGELTKPEACERCDGKGEVGAHHRDYSRPLDVRWLCSGCHTAADAALAGRVPVEARA
jgi:replicative DNA helicase